MQEPHRQHPEVNTTHEARLIYKDVEKPAENPAEKATRTWLDRLKYSLDFAMPISPIKPSLAINTAEKLAGLKEKTVEQVQKEEKKTVDHLGADAVNAVTKPPIHPDSPATDGDPEQSDPTTFEKATDWCKKMYASMDENTLKKFAWKATLTLGGFGLAYFVFRSFFGKREGSKIRPWMTIPVLGLLGVFALPYLKKAGASIMNGLAQLHPATKAAADIASAANKFSDQFLGDEDEEDKSLLDQAKDMANAAAKPVEGAGLALSGAKDRFLETFGKQSVEMAEALKNSESVEGLIANFIFHGGQVVIIGGCAYFIRGATSTVLSLPSLVVSAVNVLYKQDMESGAGFMKVYLEGAVAYATSFGVFEFFRARSQLIARMELSATQRALWHVVGKSMGWPIEIVKKGVCTAGYIMQAPKTGKLILVKAETLVRTPARKLHQIRHAADSGVWGMRPVDLGIGEDGIETLFNEWHEWRALRQRAEQLGGDISSLTHRMKAVEEELATALSVFQKKNGRVPAFIHTIQQQNLLAQIEADALAGKRGKGIPMENLRDALIKSAPTSGSKVPLAPSVSSAGVPSTPANAANAAQATPAVASSTEEVFDEATGRFMSAETAAQLDEMRAIDSSLTAEAVDEVLLAEGIDEPTPPPRSTSSAGAPSRASRGGGSAPTNTVSRTPPSSPPSVDGMRTMVGEPPIIAAEGSSFDIPQTDGTGALKMDVAAESSGVSPKNVELRSIRLADGTRRFTFIDRTTKQAIAASALGLNDEMLQRYGLAQEAFVSDGLQKMPLSPRQVRAVQAAHEIPSSLRPGEAPYKGTLYARRDILAKGRILTEAGIPHDHAMALLNRGVCGESIANLADAFKASDFVPAAGVLDDGADLSKVADGLDLSRIPAEHRALWAAVLHDAQTSGNDDALRMMRYLEESGDWGKFTELADGTTDAVKTVQKLSAWGKVAHTLNALGIVGDVASIAFAGYEAYHTHELMKNTPESSAELRSKYAERYYFHASEAAIGGVGLVAGVVGLTATGTAATIATPVALATLPISASIAALYQKHKFEEGLLHSVEDWKREFDPEESLADIRKLGFGEAVGQETRILLKDGNWLPIAMSSIPFVGSSLLPIADKLYLWKSSDTRKMQQTEIDDMHSKRVQAIVEESGMIKVPITVRDPGGSERPLNTAEVAYYDGCKRVYEEAKTRYLWENGKEILLPGGTQQNLGFLLGQAEAYATLQHDKYAGEHVHTIVLDQSKSAQSTSVFPNEHLTAKEQAKEYEVQEEQKTLAGMIAIARSAIESGDVSGGKAFLKLQLVSYLNKKCLPHALSFRVKIRETNFVTGWSDGDRGKWTELHALSALEPLIKKHADAIAQSIMDTTASPDTHGDILEGLWNRLKAGESSVASSLSNPSTQWESLSGDVTRLSLIKEYAIKQQELAEAQHGIESLRIQVAKNARAPRIVGGGHAGNAERARRSAAQQKLARYEKILAEHPQWLQSHPI